MTDSVLELTRKTLESEIQSQPLTKIQADLYIEIAAYFLKLKRSSSPAGSEVSNRLISKQAELISSMTRQLLEIRVSKASIPSAAAQLLPEERFLVSSQAKAQERLEAFLSSVASGGSSFLEKARSEELERKTTIRFTKHVNEIVSSNLKRYGPFEPEDVASVPATTADVLVSSGDAVKVMTSDEV